MIAERSQHRKCIEFLKLFLYLQILKMRKSFRRIRWYNFEYADRILNEIKFVCLFESNFRDSSLIILSLYEGYQRKKIKFELRKLELNFISFSIVPCSKLYLTKLFTLSYLPLSYEKIFLFKPFWRICANKEELQSIEIVQYRKAKRCF